jgi:1,4-dihydroxy-2-naphthoate octaprenyltransferase
MYATLGAAFLVGIYLVSVGGWPIVVIGLMSLALAVLYTGGPFPLAYHGLGDVFVFVFFGLVAVSGTYYVQGFNWPPDALLAGAAMGGLTTAILVVNNLRDMETDAAVGKRTLAVRLGKRGTRAEYVLMLSVAYVVPAVGMVWLGWPGAVSWAYLTLLLCVPPVRTVLGYRDPAELFPVLGQTSRVVAAYGLLLSLGLALA